ncbi:MAG: hypothetical protein IJU64_04475 [Bacilli bacterium]|nr:hypothetical protein [Bacilli bacterium]
MKKTNFILAGLLTVLAITSCGKDTFSAAPQLSEEQIAQKEDEAIEQALSEVPVEAAVEEVDDLPDIDRSDLVEDQVDTSSLETDPDYVIRLQGVNDVVPDAPRMFRPSLKAKPADFRIEDQNGYVVPVVPASKDGYAGFTAADGFSGSELYRITLLNEEASFYGKDPSVREIFLNLHRAPASVEENKDIRDLKDDIQLFDAKNIIEEGDDALGDYFIYPIPLELREGQIFGMGKDAQHPQDGSGFYGSFKSCSRNPNGDGYLVRYGDTEGKDLYDNLDIDKANAPVSLDNAEPVIDTDSIANYVKNSDEAKAALRAALKATGTPIDQSPKLLIPDGGSWTTRLTLDIKTSYANSTFKIAIIGTLNFQPKEHLHIALSFTISVEVTWEAQGSCGIEWKFIIPVGIKYSVYVTRDVIFTIDFKLIVSYTNKPPEEQEIDDQINDEYQAAYQNKHDDKCPISGGGAKGITGQETKTLRLFNIDVNYFFPVVIRFEVDLYIKTQLQAGLNLQYKTRSRDVVINYSNESKGSDSGASRESSEGSTEWSIVFFGTIYIEAGIEASLGIGIAGLYKYLHIRVYCDVYLDFTIQGFIRLHMTKVDGGEWNADATFGGKVEIGWGARLGIELKALFFDWDHTWPLADTVLWGIGNMNAINEFSQKEQTVSLTQNETDLNEMGFLRTAVFDGNKMSTTVTDMPASTQIHWMYGAFVSDDKYNTPVFNYAVTSVKDENGDDLPVTDVKIENGKFILNDTAPVKFTATVPGKFGDAGTKTVTVNFEATNVQTVYIDNQLCGRYRDGQALTLPKSALIKDHKKFVGYIVDGGSTIYQPDDTIHIVYNADNPRTYIYSNWVDYITYEVYFMFMKGNLLMIDEVEKGHPATPPEGSDRDQYMGAGFTFKQWSTDEYLDVQQNLIVYGLYTENSLN